MATWIAAFFSPPLSHLMVLFKNMWGQTKCMKEGSLPTFNKNYRCQWEFCLSSNCSFDPRIWCMTTRFYCFCINAEKWPPRLLNHMKHLNLSSSPACSGKKKKLHSPMTAWNYSAKQLYRLALVLLTLEYFYHLNSCFTTDTFKSVVILLEEKKYSMCVASNHLNTALFVSNCWFTLYFHSIKWSSLATAKWCSHRASPFPAAESLALVTMTKGRVHVFFTVLMILYHLFDNLVI